MRGDAEADEMDGIVGWHRTEWFGAFVVLAVSLGLWSWLLVGKFEITLFLRISSTGLCSLLSKDCSKMTK